MATILHKGVMYMENIRTVYHNLPNRIAGFTVATPDNWFTIVLNQNHTHEKNAEAYKHEYDHIMNGDFDKKCSVECIELLAHT